MNADKSPDAFRTISEVADDLDLPAHVLRFWETKFSQIKPMKRGGGRRYYRPDDVQLLRGIQHLLYDQGYTIKGVQKILKTNGVRHVMAAPDGGMDEDAGADLPEPAAPTAQATPAPAPVAQTPAPEPVQPTPPAPAAAAQPAVETAPKEPRFRPIGPRRTAEAESPSEPPSAEQMPAVTQAAPSAPVADTVAPQSDPVAAITPAEMPRPKDILGPSDPPFPQDTEAAGGLRRLLSSGAGGGSEPLGDPTIAAVRTPPAEVTRLSADDIRSLQSTLFDLLECKRQLDQARQKNH